MAVYKSKYKRLGFYINGELKKFSNGEYKTDKKEEMEVLDSLSDCRKIEEVVSKEISDVKAEEAIKHKSTKKPSVK